MIKIRIGLFVGLALVSTLAFSQTVDQGKKFLYYERYKSAKDVFDKLLAANPNNIDAVYWSAQTLIKMKDTAGAKALLQKMLATNGSAPLLLAGIGQIELFENKPDDAKQRFETALSLTKSKDIGVINAIGRSIADSKTGDPAYGIEKLTLATTIKNFNSAETYLELGDIYRQRLVDGGNAVTNYQKALAIDPKLAEAKYKIGKIYLTQNNKEYFLPAFEEATQLDPAYRPAYFELFYYWYFRDVNKAAPYLDKYTANSDPGPDADYLKTDFLYASGKPADAKAKAQELINQYGDKVNPRMYRMIAFTSDTLGDIPGAKQAMLTFLSKEDSSRVLPTDYEELAKIYSKIPGSESLAVDNYKLAISKDTIPENTNRYIREVSEFAVKTGNKQTNADIAELVYKQKKNPVNSDLYNYGYTNYQAGNYVKADSIFCTVYESKYPNEIFGYLWCARSKQAQDTSMTQGLAVPAYQKLAEMARSLDSVKYKAQAIQSYFYLASYFNDIKKDKPMAIENIKKVLEVDPANAAAANILTALTKPPPKQPAAKPKTATKTNGK